LHLVCILTKNIILKNMSVSLITQSSPRAKMSSFHFWYPWFNAKHVIGAEYFFWVNEWVLTKQTKKLLSVALSLDFTGSV
jgi:hypothetical protein